MRDLLHKDEHRRLGSKSGASDVKAHPFFKGVKWALLRHLKPPIIPKVAFAGDTNNFRELKESSSLDLDWHAQSQEDEDEEAANIREGNGMHGADSSSSTPKPTRRKKPDPFINFNSGEF